MIPEKTFDDTIPVRADEVFEVAKVADFCRGRIPGSDNELKVRQFGGGKANLTYLLDYGTHQYVLRRPPLGPVAASAHDMGREFKVLSRLYEQFPLAPRAFLFCEDPELIGAPFFVMERREGVVVRGRVPDIYSAYPDAARRMSTGLVDALAAFHAVDYAAVGLGDLGEPTGFIARQIEGWYKRWHKAKNEEVPAMDAVYEWLKAHQPTTSHFSLVHNDYKLDNVMLDQDDPGKLVAIFDWDMCTLGDPLADLGSLLCYWTEPDDPPLWQAMSMMPTGNLGFLRRDELVERYVRGCGRDVSHIQFYHALGLYRLTVIIAQIYIRYVRGQTQDHRFAAMGQMIPMMAAAALQVAEKGVL